MATSKIKIVQGNDLPLCKKLTTIIDGEIVPVNIDDMTELKVLFGTSSQSKATEVEWTDGTDSDHAIIHFRLESTQIAKLGTYNIWIVGKYGINDVVVSYGTVIEVIEWSAKSTAGEYIYTEEQALDDSIFIPAGMTDEELERLKQVYAEKIEEAEQAKEEAEQERAEWERKAEELDGVAKESTLEKSTIDILAAITGIPATDLTPILQRLDNSSYGLAALRNAIDTIDFSALAKADKLEQVRALVAAIPTTDPATPQDVINAKTELLNRINAATEPLAQEGTVNRRADEIKTAIAKGGGNPSKMAYEAMKRVQEYLYEIEYSELDYEAARAYFATHFAPINGACTALRKGDIIGRNYDWTYSKEVSFLVRTKAHNGRYASIGMAGSIAALTTDTIGEYSEEFKWMPFRLLDGLNEKGVYANVNMLNNAEGRTLPTTGTVPLIEERERICSAILVRYILDNFATPQEACEYIRNYVAVYPPYHDGVTTDLHFAVSSKEQLYYLCFEPDNSGVFRTMYVDVKNQPLPFVMTNFRMWNAQGIFDTTTGYYDRFKNPDYSRVEKYGMGIERANLCLDFVRDTETTQSVLGFMTNDLKYTNAYLESAVPTWLTEFVGDYSQEDLARDSAVEDFERILGIVRQRYAERSRETALTWQTVHSVTYDLEHLTMQLIVQEGNADDALTIDCFKSLPTTKEDVAGIDIDLSPVISNQRKMMVNFGMSEGEPQLVALTDTEIINTYDGYDSEGTHIEGIADQTYGHLVPAQVTIDDEPFTFYQERTYSDYGYSVLYRNGVAIDTTTTHPQEDDELTTTI